MNSTKKKNLKCWRLTLNRFLAVNKLLKTKFAQLMKKGIKITRKVWETSWLTSSLWKSFLLKRKLFCDKRLSNISKNNLKTLTQLILFSEKILTLISRLTNNDQLSSEVKAFMELAVQKLSEESSKKWALSTRNKASHPIKQENKWALTRHYNNVWI